MFPGYSAPSSQLTAYLALAIGFFGLMFLSPKWLVPIAAWVTPCALLYFTRITDFKRKWLLLFGVLFLAGLIATYEVFPMPTVILIIFSLIDAAKNLLIYFLDKKLRAINSRFIQTFFFPAAMVTKEYIESTGGGGVWGSIANTQFEFSWLIQLVSVTGIWGVTFMIYWFASVTIWVIQKKMRREKFAKGLLAYTFIFLIVLGYGVVRYYSVKENKLTNVKIAGLTVPAMGFLENLYEDVSGKTINIDLKISQSSAQLQELNKAFLPFIENPDSTKFPRGFAAMSKLHDSLFTLSQKAAKSGAKIISWSEGNGMVLKSGEQELLQKGMSFAKENKIYLLMAMAVIQPGKITPGKKFMENKAILISPEAEVLNVLYKNKPVPMVENSVPGNQVVPAIPTAFGTLSTSICYDADFPQLMSQLGKKKSDVLFLPSGDWYAIAPYHSYMAAIRGIENGCSVVRQASGGLSIISDYRGRISLKHDFFKEREEFWVSDAQFGHVSTIYSVIGDVLAYLCLLFAAAAILYLVGRSIQKFLLKRKGRVA